MADADRDVYLPPSHLSREFGVHPRTIERWGNTDLVRTKANPRRKQGRLYHRGDVERLARAVPTPAQPEVARTMPEPSTELVPRSDMLEALNHKDAQLAEVNEKLLHAAREVGKLQGQLEAQTKLLDAAERERQRLVAFVAEREH